MPERRVDSLSDKQVEQLITSILSDFKDGTDTRRDLIEGLVAVLTFQDDIIVSDGPLRDDGRMSFGHKREGIRGVGLFLPESPVAEAVETRRDNAD